MKNRTSNIRLKPTLLAIARNKRNKIKIKSCTIVNSQNSKLENGFIWVGGLKMSRCLVVDCHSDF